ncbi:hypothetical protein RvY_12600 [Ramazzottius varieornatus]|uniref:Uncharacterized protein n=1 Tax=Ramazzottius varieornatus TaxID=947166 RepID=A0A1D1VQH9_RAMVA|nr:hypothetical protein RvY_12600 [Ramazzottius varieornatus]
MPSIMFSKRGYDEEDGVPVEPSKNDVDLKPLTKKLKGTHLDEEMTIDNGNSYASSPSYASPPRLVYPGSPHGLEYSPPATVPYDNANAPSTSHRQERVTQHDTDMDLTDYDPELDERTNPFYYSKNRLLHEAHLERIRRGKM